MKTLNVPITDTLKTLLDSYSKANGMHKKKVVELALEGYLKKAVPPAAKQVDTPNPFDDHPAFPK